MPGHRRPQEPREPRDILAGRRLIVQAVVNGFVGFAMLVAAPGNSPALAFLALVLPLRLWAVAFLLVLGLFIFGRLVLAHTVAAFLWLVFAFGAALGLVNGTTGAPAASLIFAGLLLGMAGFHTSGLVFRLAEHRAGRG